MKTIEGMITAMVTSFTDDGALDEAGLRAAVRHQIDSGAVARVSLRADGVSTVR